MNFFTVLLQQDGQQPLLNFLIGVPENQKTPSKSKPKPKLPSTTATKSKSAPTTPYKPSSTQAAIKTATTPAGKTSTIKKATPVSKSTAQAHKSVTAPTTPASNGTAAKKPVPVSKKEENGELKRTWANMGGRMPSRSEVNEILKFIILTRIKSSVNSLVISYNELAITFLRETGKSSGGFFDLGYGNLHSYLKKNLKEILPENYAFVKKLGLVNNTTKIPPPTVEPVPAAPTPVAPPSPPASSLPEPSPTPIQSTKATPTKLTYFQARKQALQQNSSPSPSSSSPADSTTPPASPSRFGSSSRFSSSASPSTAASQRSYASRYYKPKDTPESSTTTEVAPPSPSTSTRSATRPSAITAKTEEQPKDPKEFTQAVASKKFIEAVVKGRVTEVKKAIEALNRLGIRVVNCIKVADSKNNKFPFNGWTPVHITAWTGTTDVLQHLLSLSTDIPKDVNQVNDHNQTPLHIAALKGQYDVAKVLLSNGGKVDATNPNRFQQTPLQIASMKGHESVADLLTAHGADVRKVNDNPTGPRSAMLFAAQKGHSGIVHDLLGIDPTLGSSEENGLTPLSLAIKDGNVDISVAITLSSKIDVAHACEMAIQRKQPAVLAKLLTHIPDISKHAFYTWAARSADKRILDLIIAKSTAAINCTPSYYDDAPLCLAVKYKANGEFIYAMLKAGASDTKVKTLQGYDMYQYSPPIPAIYHAVNLNNESAMKSLLPHANIEYCHTDGNYLLHIAAQRMLSKDAMVMLLNATAATLHVDTENEDGQTALHIAAGNGMAEVVEELIKYRANVNKSNPKKNQMTPLHYAAAKGHAKVLSVLLRNGAKVNAEMTKYPYNALGLCTGKKYHEAADVLRSFGATEAKKAAAPKSATGKVQLMTFEDTIPVRYEYKQLSLLERQQLQGQPQAVAAAVQTVVTTSSAGAQQRPWKTVRIFISSSFKDMHAERSYIVSHVMPTLRKKCAQRKVHIMEVDLRWGVTEEEAQSGKVLELCLEEVNRCNIFVNLLGERYGWVPTPKQVPDHVRAKFHWVDGNSVTHMEVLQAIRTRATHSFFYQRATAATETVPEACKLDFVEVDPQSQKKLKDLKTEIARGRVPVTTYTPVFEGIDSNGIPIAKNLETFGSNLLDRIWSVVDAENPESVVPPDVLQMEREYHDEFVQIRNRRFVGREAIITQIQNEATNFNGKPLVVVGEAGAGKSALMARISLVASNSYTHVYPHFIGASPESTSVRFMLWRLCTELKRAHYLDVEIPEEYEDLIDTFSSVLQSAASSGTNTLILIDALNQLDKSSKGKDLHWLPQTLPDRVKIIISCLPGEYYDALRSRGVPEIKVGNLTESDRSEIVTMILADYNKKLDRTQLTSLLAKKEAINPLFLVVACEELRLFGIYEKISEKIARFPDTVPELMVQVLERLEQEFGLELVRNALVFLNCARHGLLEVELLDLLAVPTATWNALFLSLEFYLRPIGKTGDGQLDFFHRQVAKAVQKRYAGYIERAHESLADYFANKADPEGDNTLTGTMPRPFQELPYHLVLAGREDKLVDLLCSLDFINKRCEFGQTYNLVAEYNQVKCDEAKFNNWKNFVLSNAHIFASTPEIVFQQAINSEDYDIKQGAEISTLYKNVPYISKLNATSQATPHVLSFVSSSQANCAKFSPSASTIVSGYKAGNICLWDSRTGEELVKVNAHKGRITTTNFSSSGRFVVSCSGDVVDMYIKIWDGIKLQSLASFPFKDRSEGECEVLCAKFRPSNEDVVAACSSDNTIKIWDWRKNKLLHKLDKHRLPVHKFDFSHNGNFLASVSSDRTVMIWNVNTGQVVQTFSEFTKPVFDVAFSSDDSRLVAVSHKDIKVFNIANGTVEASMQGHADTISTCAFSPDGLRVATGSWDRKIKVWDVKEQTCVRTIEGHGHMVNAVTYSHDGAYILSASADMSCKLFDAWSTESSLGAAHSALVKGMAYCPATDTLVTGAWDNLAKVFDGNAYERATLNGHAKRINAVDITANGATIVTASGDNTLKLWDAHKMIATDTLRGHKDKIFWCQLSHDGRYVVSGSCDHTIRVWDVSTAECVGVLTGHTDWVVVVAFSPYSRRLVSGSQDTTLKVWNSQTGEDLETLRGHTQIILDAKFSPDGKYIVSCSMDQTIIIWDAHTYQKVKTLLGHTHEVSWIGFLGDNDKSTHIVSTSSDTTVRIWDIESGKQELIYYCASAAMVGVVMNNKKISVGDSLGNVYILQLNQPDLHIGHIEMRVGKIVTVTKDPNIAKLYTFMIDVGESKPRQVVSGLVPYYTIPQLKGKLVVCCCNIKPATLAGITSYGMMLGANNGSKVELLQPPEGSQPGEHITVAGYPTRYGRQFDDKQKEEFIEPYFSTDGTCVATFRGEPLKTASGGDITVPTLMYAKVN